MRVKKSGLAGLRGDRRKRVEVFLKFSRKYDLWSSKSVGAKNLLCKLRVSYFLEYGSAGFLEAEVFIQTKRVSFLLIRDRFWNLW